YGFNDYLYIGDCEPLERFKMANYVMKYITKDLVQSRFNKKMYWCSRGLKNPTVTNTLASNKKLKSLKEPDKLIITENDYYINNPETGEVFNKINDFTVYNPLPF
ncbi:MAG TPA: hypothetical protein VK982_06530, partial [Bacteroidales bacterium]|nr:hypothetical protein [Bacteroidales bacterium]